MSNTATKAHISKNYWTSDAVSKPFKLQHRRSFEKIHCFHMAFSKKSGAKKLIPRINKIISELKAEGAIDKILKGE